MDHDLGAPQTTLPGRSASGNNSDLTLTSSALTEGRLPTERLIHPLSNPDLERLRSEVSPKIYNSVLESLSKGHIKGQDAERLLVQVASGELDERLVIQALSIAAAVKDAQWIANRLEEGGISLLLKFPTKKLYAAYHASLRSSPSSKPLVSNETGTVAAHSGRGTQSSDSEGTWNKSQGIKPLSLFLDETSEEGSIETVLMQCATASEDKKKREKVELNDMQDYKKIALKVAAQITSCSEVDNLVPNPVQTDFIADTPGEDVMSVVKYRQLVGDAKATRARLIKELSNKHLV